MTLTHPWDWALPSKELTEACPRWRYGFPPSPPPTSARTLRHCGTRRPQRFSENPFRGIACRQCFTPLAAGHVALEWNYSLSLMGPFAHAFRLPSIFRVHLCIINNRHIRPRYRIAYDVMFRANSFRRHDSNPQWWRRASLRHCESEMVYQFNNSFGVLTIVGDGCIDLPCRLTSRLPEI
jgi:hypothetical protein